MKVALGDKVKDTVSGYKGIVIGRSDFLNGCTRIGIQQVVGKDGSYQEPQWFDEPQLEVIKTKVTKQGPRDTGGPMVSIPTRHKPR